MKERRWRGRREKQVERKGGRVARKAGWRKKVIGREERGKRERVGQGGCRKMGVAEVPHN
jgi:hypothetical protein